MAALLSGEGAIQQAHALAAQGPYLTVYGHPTSDARCASLQLLALALPHRAIVIDVARTQALGELLRSWPLLGAVCGNSLAHQLQASYQHIPRRIACAQVAHALMAGDVKGPQTLDALCAQYLQGTQVGAAPGATAAPGALGQFAFKAQKAAQLLEALGHRLKQQGLSLVSRIESSVVGPIAAMEHHGFPLDNKSLQACLRAEAQELAHLAQSLSQALGVALHPTQDDGTLLAALRASGLPIASLSEKPQTHCLAQEVAKNLSRFIALRRLARSLGERFLQMVGDDGRIHSHFVQIGARSGRMACTRPNLQAITADTSRRACFRAPQGHVFVMGDYAACELRILAEMSGDDALQQAISSHTDLHAAIATTMFGTAVSKSSHPQLRHRAKTIAFGLIYGMGPKALGAVMNVSVPEAKELTSRFFGAFPKVRPHLEAQSDEGLARGFATTLSGRRCALVSGSSPAEVPRSALVRMARNLPIQGTSADIIKVALAAVHRALKPHPRAAVVHCIHDEIVTMCPQQDAAQVQEILKTAMEAAKDGLLRRTPLAVDLRIQSDWQAH